MGGPLRNSKLLSGRIREDGTLDTSEKEAKGGRNILDAIAAKEAAAAAKAVADEEAVFTKAQESQRKALKRKGRRASILTSPQGVVDQLGIPG